MPDLDGATRNNLLKPSRISLTQGASKLAGAAAVAVASNISPAELARLFSICHGLARAQLLHRAVASEVLGRGAERQRRN